MLGVAPWQGRLIEPQDEVGCDLTKVVASYAFWKSEMGGAPITANSTLMVEGRDSAGAGRDAALFFGLVVGDRFDLAYPICTPPNPRREVFAVLRDGSAEAGLESAAGDRNISMR